MLKTQTALRIFRPWNRSLCMVLMLLSSAILVSTGMADGELATLDTLTEGVAVPSEDFPIALFFPTGESETAGKPPVIVEVPPAPTAPAFRDFGDAEQTLVIAGEWLTKTDALIAQYLDVLESSERVKSRSIDTKSSGRLSLVQDKTVAGTSDRRVNPSAAVAEPPIAAPSPTLAELLAEANQRDVSAKTRSTSVASPSAQVTQNRQPETKSATQSDAKPGAAVANPGEASELVARRPTSSRAAPFRNTFATPQPPKQSAGPPAVTNRSTVTKPVASSASSAVEDAVPTPTSPQSADNVQPPSPKQIYVPAEPAVVITRRMQQLRPRIEKTLRFYENKPLNTKDDSAWSIMHSILGYGVNGKVAINSSKGRRTNAINWMCWNYPCANRRLLYLDKGYIYGHEGPGSQGHPGQFLAMLAQVNLKRDYPVHVQGNQFTVEDLINSEMYTCDSKRELTFKLLALSHYLPSNARWKSASGEVWSIPRLLEIELSQPVNGAACGGTHRIMGINFALKTRQMRGEPIDGIYVRAQKYIRDYQRYAMTLRNRDGSFSSDWFKRRSNWGDKDRQLQTTGHILEWLAYSVSRDQLSDPRIVESVDFLSYLMTRNRYHDWQVGPRGHALRALSLYYSRVFQQQRAGTPIVAVAPVETQLR